MDGMSTCILQGGLVSDQSGPSRAVVTRQDISVEAVPRTQHVTGPDEDRGRAVSGQFVGRGWGQHGDQA